MARTSNQTKELMKKLQALAERGVGGEKEGAEKKLAQLLKVNNMTEADLDKDDVNYYLFSYQGPAMYRLLSQCIYKTLGSSDFKLYKTKGTRNKIGAYCTREQKLTIDLDFEFYSALFDKEVETLMSAFISKQDIFPVDVPTSSIDSSTLTEEQLEEWRKKQAYERNMQKRTRVSDLIEDKKGAKK